MKPAATPPSAKKAEKKPEKVATTGASDNGGSKKGTKADKSPTSAARGGGGSSASSSPANQQSNALYVGDLSPQVTETMLFEKFSSVGQVMSIRVCRDAVNRRSLGYAYVNYQSSADAAKAIDALNFGELCGRPMRIMWSQRDATTRNNTAGNVFIKNLEKSIDNKAIYQAFTVFGPILSCKVVLDERGDSKGFGFIHFKNEADAEKAIQSVNGMMLSGRPVYAGKFVPRSARQKEDGDVPRRFTNVFVKNFGDVLDKPKLEELFSKYGKIASSAVMTDRDGRPRGFGFVAFENADDAEKAVAALNEYQLPDSDRKLFVGRAQKKSERIAELRKKYDMDKMDRQRPNPGTNLFVKNLSDAVDEDMLREHFEPFGKIATIKVMREENGTTRGFGFVNFEQKDDAHNAMTSLNGKDIGGQDIAVALAQQREERRRQIASLYMRDLAAQRQQHLPMGVFYTAVPGQGGYMMTPTRYMMGAMPQVRNLQQRWSTVNLPPAQPPSHVAYAMPPIVGPFIPPPVIMASNPPPPPPVQQSTVSSNA